MAFAMPQPQFQQPFAMPQANASSSTHFYNNAYPPLYTQTQQYSTLPQQTTSPISAPPTPTTVSPNSQIQLHRKGPGAKAFYTPAVLRPTENPRPKKTISFPSSRNSPSPLTPPGSLHNSLDSLDTNVPKQTIVNRRNTRDSGKASLSLEGVTLYEEEILLRDPEEPGYGKVTGSPTRIHWKADSSTTACMDPTCNRLFSYFNRKHHCRRCGSIFCDTHSSNLIPLNQDAEFHPFGSRVRGCDGCWRDYTGWEIKRVQIHEQRERLKKGDNKDIPISSSPTAISSPISAFGIDGEGLSRARTSNGIGMGIANQESGQLMGQQGQQPSQVAASVPGNWCWSTF